MFQDPAELEEKLGYHFINQKYLNKALTHRSYAAERKLNYSNERLEFLGDSVINLIVTEYLVEKFPDKTEGYLSKIKSHLVSSKNLYRWAKRVNLENYVKISIAEMKSGGREKPQILANTFEAIIAALYLDGGFDSAKRIIRNLLECEKEIKIEDYKSTLQELCQKKFRVIPVYKIISEEGPQHKRRFKVSVVIKDKEVSDGEGYSKKEAENNAAKKALAYIRGL
ncbi:MAG: ribonuclease III [Elusimicrobiales bacterium]